MGDLCARYGGEEFVVVLSDTPENCARVVAERIRDMVEGSDFAISVEPHNIKCTSSFGVSGLKKGDTADTILKRADDCLYKAKESGRNAVICSSDL